MNLQWKKVNVFPSCMGIHTAHMTRDEWVTARTLANQQKEAVGGSEIGVLLGLDTRFNSPLRMYYEKVGLWPALWGDNKFAFMGRVLEDTIIQLWRSWQGDWEDTMVAYEKGIKSRKSRHCNYLLYNPKYPHLTANVDNRIISSPDAPNSRGILECKTISGHAADRYETGIPPKHIAQAQSYMLITETEYSEIAVLKDGRDFDVWPIHANKSIQEKILEAAYEFFERVRMGKRALAAEPNASQEERIQIVQEYEPETMGGDDEYDFLAEKAKMLELHGTKEPPEEVARHFAAYMRHKEAAKEAKKNMDILKTAIRQQMISEGIYKYVWSDEEHNNSVTQGNKFVLYQKKRKK